VRIPSRSGRSRLAASVTTLIAAATVIGLALAAPSAFQNGSFETSTIGGGGSVLSLATGSTQITGWTVAQGSVDYVNTVDWAAADGSYSVDLGGGSSGSQNGATIGGISQTFLTTVGQTYTVQFDMGGNPRNTPAIKHMTVSAAGTSATYAIDTTGFASNNVGWTTYTFTFTATATSTTLAFTDVEKTTAGAVLDNVHVLVPVSGKVFEDVNYGGGAGRNATTALAAGGTGRSGVRVELYDSTGAFVSATTTAAGGTYSFNVDVADTYTVRVVNSTVTSGRSGAVATLLPVQTYRTNASSGTAVAVTDHVGGETPTWSVTATAVPLDALVR